MYRRISILYHLIITAYSTVHLCVQGNLESNHLQHLALLLQVFSHLSCLVYEGTVVAEHWLPYSTNLSMNEYSRFSGSSWELSNLSPYPLEFVDYGATYYRLYFADHGRCIACVCALNLYKRILTFTCLTTSCKIEMATHRRILPTTLCAFCPLSVGEWQMRSTLFDNTT